MSMISSLIDKLNKSADEWNGNNMFELPRMCREAADTIWELRDDLQRANAENAKLRELVRDMYSCISHANEADWFHFERDKFGCGMSCTVNGEACGLCALAGRMRELGIETGDGVS